MKKILFPKIRIYAYLRAVLLPQEGRFAIVTSVGSGMRWTRLFRQTSETCADGEVVWSWCPKAGIKSAGDDCRRRRQQCLVSGESSKETVKTIAQGMSMFRLDLW
jgi:hypothetical protein